MGERKGRDDHWRRVSLTITPSAALNLIAPSACVCARASGGPWQSTLTDGCAPAVL